ncbi:type VII secretion-associated serine protease mycosin [Rhodococcus sp. NPDC058505]|uniref:type VII secretion-associated serine protease mycosin n=1 Tax=Rhodococcus sp. NPDC058505 TaxID=3346531 RepID=UPI00365157AE
MGVLRAVVLIAAMAVPFVGSGSAAAVAPPTIDPGGLPPGDLPPVQSELRDPCPATTPGSDPALVPAPQRALDLESVWPLSTGRGQLVAVIDTGVERHPRLPGLMPGGDFVSTGDGTADCDAHGTLVAGLIAATRSDATGFAGVAPDARILTIRQSSNIYRQVGAADADGRNARGVGNLTTLASAVRRAADLGATVINISEVACVPPGFGDHRALGAAIDYAARIRDAVIVAAAGNLDACRQSNPAPDPARPNADPWAQVTTVATPAWYDDRVLAVGSVDPDGAPSEFTLPGPWVDVAAPGTGITSLDPRRPRDAGLTDAVNGGPIEGTSFAAPYVAGTAALVRARFPELTAAQVIARIERTAHAPAAGWDPYVGHGVVDPVAAVTAPDREPVTSPRSVTVPAPAAAPPPDTRPRTVAMVGAGVVAVLLALGVLASFPLRRRFQRADTSIG